MDQAETDKVQLTNPIVSADGELSDPLYSLLCEAVDEHATDVHLDPQENGKIVRFRVDGTIHRKHRLQDEEHKRILTQVKVAAGFNIDRSFLPEEGMIIFEHEDSGHRYHLRVSTVPTGLERVAIHFRFLSGKASPMNFEELGMSAEHRKMVDSVIASPMGIVLIAGVTGSGKSSTLYAIADALDLDSNIGVSIEDPIEMNVAGLRQIEVNDEHDFQMHDGLRTSLRMDPDAVFIGEIRDRASAITAARAGIAGRLVVSTVHAPDPATAVEALHHYKVPNYITASALRLVITQYLLRRICPHCATKRAVEPEERELFEMYGVSVPDQLLEPRACTACRRYGYKGRTGIYELTTINDELAQDIASGKNRVMLLQRFRKLGGSAFMVDALEKVNEGIVSMADATQLYLNTERK